MLGVSDVVHRLLWMLEDRQVNIPFAARIPSAPAAVSLTADRHVDGEGVGEQSGP